MRRIDKLLVCLVLSLSVAGCSDAAQDSDAQHRSEVAEQPGSQAAGETDRLVPAIPAAELATRLDATPGLVLLDVRTPEEFAAGHIPGALNIPYDELEQRLDELQAHRQAEVVVYCRSGRRAKIAEQLLVDSGFTNVLDLDGHMREWTAANYPVSEPQPCC